MVVLAQQKASQRGFNPNVWTYGGSEGGETRDINANISKPSMKKLKLQVRCLFPTTEHPCARFSKFTQKMPSLGYLSCMVIANSTVIDNLDCYFRTLKSL